MTLVNLLKKLGRGGGAASRLEMQEGRAECPQEALDARSYFMLDSYGALQLNVKW